GGPCAQGAARPGDIGARRVCAGRGSGGGRGTRLQRECLGVAVAAVWGTAMVSRQEVSYREMYD
ncbi:MAG: hypothetical protein ACK5MM_13855, partial [Planctomyces sp.]